MSERSAGGSEFHRGWPVVASAMLGIGLGLSPMPFYSVGPLAPELAKAFHWGFGQIMGGLTIMTAVVLVAGPLVGLLSDRFGVRRVVLVSAPLFGLAFMTFALSNGSILLFYTTWTLVALAGAGTLPITWTRAVNNWFDASKGLALGLALLGTGLFGYLAKPLISLTLSAFGWRLTYLILGALPLVISLPAAFLLFHDADGGRAGAQGRLEADARRSAAPGLTLRQSLAQWRFWVLALAFIPISFAIGGPIPNLENILKHAGFSPPQTVSLASLVGLSVVGGRMAGGWLIDRIWAPAVAFVMLSAPAVGCWMFAHGGLNYWLAAASIVMLGFAAGVEFDLMAFLVARYFGMKGYGGVYGALYGFFALGAGVGPVIFGMAFDRSGSYAQPLMLSAGLFLIGATLLLTLGRYRTFEPVTAAQAISRAEEIADGRPA
jgi:predicted MFS family arabinose efflux permease